MEKTAITQAIKHIAEVIEKMTSSSQILGLTQAMDILEGYKNLEKEQIEKSFDEGWLQCNIYELPEKSRKHFKTANDYFDFTYTQNSE